MQICCNRLFAQTADNCKQKGVRHLDSTGADFDCKP